MIRLALPVVATYLGFMLMGIVDLICVGRVNAESIGAVGVGTSLFAWVMTFGLGLLAGLDYLVSYAQGAQRPQDGHRAMIQSLLATTLFSIPATGLLFWAAGHLDWIGVQPAIEVLARPYLRVLAFSLWPLFVFSAFRQYLTAQGVAVPAMVILLFANLLNAGVNWVLDFGHWGAPTLGATGAGVATLVSRMAMMLAMGIYLWVWDRRNGNLFKQSSFGYDAEVMKRFLKLGIPSALQMAFEVGVFALSTTLAARLNSAALAAHQVVLNIASLTFMVPLGLSTATSVLVGQALGAGDPAQARRMGWRGFALGLSFMFCSGVVLFTARHPILSIFTTDAAVRETASQILLIAALFQLSDGTQVVGAGALRGLGDTRTPMLANLCGHWLIGLPTGVLLCFKLNWGLQGLWAGLSLGLTAVGLSLLLAWRWRTRSLLGPAIT